MKIEKGGRNMRTIRATREQASQWCREGRMEQMCDWTRETSGACAEFRFTQSGRRFWMQEE